MSEAISSAIRWASRQFEDCSESPRLDAEILLAHCLQKPRSYLYSWPDRSLEEDCWQAFRQLAARRLEPTPIAYLVGEREFYSLNFHTRADALVPRPETELLVEQALQLIPPETPQRVCDLGTGSGIIAITLKKERPGAALYATDVDPGCLKLARENAIEHGVDIEWFESDWYSAIPAALEFDLIASNPPYIAAEHPFLDQGDLPAEPRHALTPGHSGLEALQIIVQGASSHLVAGGHIVLEHGYDQEAALSSLLAANGFTDIRCEYDHNDLPRTTVAKRVENGQSAA